MVLDLNKMVDGAFKKFTVNPLFTLGFSSILLDLGINDEKVLHKMVKRFMQTWEVETHSDKTGVERSERQKELKEVFEFLQDFDNFAEALSELRQEKSIRRSDENASNRAGQELRKTSLALQKTIEKNTQLSEHMNAQIREKNLRVVNSMSMRALTFSTHTSSSGYMYKEIEGLDTATEILAIAIKGSFEITRAPSEDDIERMRNHYIKLCRAQKERVQSSSFRNDRAEFWGDFRSKGFTNVPIKALINQELDRVKQEDIDVSRSLPIIEWNELYAAERWGMSGLGGQSDKHSLKKTELMKTIRMIEKRVGNYPRFRTLYIKALTLLRDSLSKEGNSQVSNLFLYPRIINLDKAWIQQGGNRETVVIGCIPLMGNDTEDLVFPSILSSASHKRTKVGLQFSKDQIARQCRPVLVQNSFLIESPTRTVRVASANGREDSMSELERKLYKPHASDSAYNFVSRNLIVAVR